MQYITKYRRIVAILAALLLLIVAQIISYSLSGSPKSLLESMSSLLINLSSTVIAFLLPHFFLRQKIRMRMKIL